MFSAHFLRVCTCATRKNNKKMEIVSGLKGFFKKSLFIAKKSCFTAKLTARFTTGCIAKSATNLLPSSQRAHSQADANTRRPETAFSSTRLYGFAYQLVTMRTTTVLKCIYAAIPCSHRLEKARPALRKHAPKHFVRDFLTALTARATQSAHFAQFALSAQSPASPPTPSN